METLATDRPPKIRDEGFIHYVAREGRVFLRWFIVLCLVATVAFMVSPFWMAAVVPALLILGAYVLLILTNEVERRSDVEAHDALERSTTAIAEDVLEDHAEDDQFQPEQAYLIKRESRTGIAILVSVGLAALLIAFIIFELKLLAIGSLVLFAYMLLIAAPLWLGWFNDDIEDETRKLEGEPQSPSVKTE